MKLLITLTILLTGCFGFPATAATETDRFIQFTTLGIGQGLSQSKVTAILIDASGQLWVGTEFGLNRYISGTFKPYYCIQGDDSSIPSNEIRFITEDTQNNIWVGTNKGLVLYDKANDCFIRQHITGTGDTEFVASCITVGGELYAGGVNSRFNLYKYDCSSGEWAHVADIDLGDRYTAFQEMTAMDENHIVINTKWFGIYIYDIRRNNMKKLLQPQAPNCTKIFIDSNKRLWCSIYNKGIYGYHGDRLIYHFDSNNSNLSNDIVLDILENNGDLWLATDGGGINILDMDSLSFSSVGHNISDPHSLPDNSIYRLYLNGADNILAGSVRSGLINIELTYARSYNEVSYGNRYGLSNRSVLSCCQDDSGTIWIGTDGGGINSMDPETGEFRHFAATKGMHVTSLVDYSDSHILFNIYNRGFYLLDKASGYTEKFHFSSSREEIARQGITVSLLKDGDRIIVNSENIHLYNTLTRELSYIGHNPNRYSTPMALDRNGKTLYFIDTENEIAAYDIESGVRNTISETIPVNVRNICCGSDGTIWIATDSGLMFFNETSGECKEISTPLLNEASSLITDSEGRLWIGTHKGIYIYWPEEKKFMILGEMDGVDINEITPDCHCLLNSGDIIFGGVNGLSYIKKGITCTTSPDYSIQPTDIIVNGRSVSHTSGQSDRQDITVPYNFSTLEIRTSLGNRRPFSEETFKFTLRNRDGAAVFSYFSNYSLLINNLPSGEYAIHCAYLKKDGEWSSEQVLCDLNVRQQWYKSTWFIIAAIMFAAMAACLTSYYIVRREKILHAHKISRLKSKANEEKINFLISLSHELRTPLSLICAPLKRIIDHKTENSKVEEHLKIAYSNAWHMKNIIDMVLDIQKYETGAMNIVPVNSLLNDWIKNICEKFKVEFENNGISLEFIPDNSVGIVQFDSKKCDFVLSNLLMNALKFSDRGSTTTVRSNILPEKDFVRISVSDMGSGLNDADMDFIFDNFYQGNHDKGGSGIGLAYAKKIVSLHNGRIGAFNNEHAGATFWFDLPLSAVAEGPLDKASDLTELRKTVPPGPEDLLFLKNISVMIVEDNNELRTYLKDSLRNYFAHIYTAEDGKKGYNAILDRMPDIIISDVMMPAMNGFQLCHEVKTNLEISHIPFILLTAYSDPQNLAAGYKTGADVFLPKPFDIDALISVIYNCLKLRESIRNKYRFYENLTNKQISFSNADEKLLTKVDETIDQNMDTPDLNVNFIAASVNISTSLLFKKIKALTGMSIIEYVTRKKIEKACMLLSNTSMSITEISEKTGFSSLKYFTKVFKKIKSCTPTEFRNPESSRPY